MGSVLITRHMKRDFIAKRKTSVSPILICVDKVAIPVLTILIHIFTVLRQGPVVRTMSIVIMVVIQISCTAGKQKSVNLYRSLVMDNVQPMSHITRKNKSVIMYRLVVRIRNGLALTRTLVVSPFLSHAGNGNTAMAISTM